MTDFISSNLVANKKIMRLIEKLVAFPDIRYKIDLESEISRIERNAKAIELI